MAAGKASSRSRKYQRLSQNSLFGFIHCFPDRWFCPLAPRGFEGRLTAPVKFLITLISIRVQADTRDSEYHGVSSGVFCRRSRVSGLSPSGLAVDHRGDLTATARPPHKLNDSRRLWFLVARILCTRGQERDLWM